MGALGRGRGGKPYDLCTAGAVPLAQATVVLGDRAACRARLRSAVPRAIPDSIAGGTRGKTSREAVPRVGRCGTRVSCQAMKSTWETRDLVVLESIVRLLDGPGYLQVITGAPIIEDTGLANEDVGRALLALDGPYINLKRVMSGGDASYWIVMGVTPLARLTVGQWPTPEQLA